MALFTLCSGKPHCHLEAFSLFLGMKTGWSTETAWSRMVAQKGPYLGFYFPHRALDLDSLCSFVKFKCCFHTWSAKHGKLLVQEIKKWGTMRCSSVFEGLHPACNVVLYPQWYQPNDQQDTHGIHAHHQHVWRTSNILEDVAVLTSRRGLMLKLFKWVHV